MSDSHHKHTECLMFWVQALVPNTVGNLMNKILQSDSFLIKLKLDDSRYVVEVISLDFSDCYLSLLAR